MLQTNDALGGAGSIAQDLRGIVVGGLSRAVDGYLSKKYPLTSFNDPLTVTASGAAQPASEPAQKPSVVQQAAEFFRNPLVLGVGAALVIGVALFAILRK